MTLYTWTNVTEETMPSAVGEVLRRFVGGEKMTVARVTFTAGAITDPHRHDNEQFSLVLNGEVKFTVDGDPVLVGEGEIIHLPSGCLHGARAISAATIIDVFAPPRADWGPPR